MTEYESPSQRSLHVYYMEQLSSIIGVSRRKSFGFLRKKENMKRKKETFHIFSTPSSFLLKGK